MFLEAHSFLRVSLSENLLYIDSHHIYRSKQTAKNINNEILAVKGQGIAVFWNFVVTVAFFNRNFIVVLLILWYKVIDA